MQRNPAKEALRWKLPKTKRQTGGPPEEEAVEWTSISYRQTWDWITHRRTDSLPTPSCLATTAQTAVSEE